MSLRDRIERHLAERDATPMEMAVALDVGVTRIRRELEQMQRDGKAKPTKKNSTAHSRSGPELIWTLHKGRKVEIGLTARIRAELVHGPATVVELSERTGAPRRKVSSMLAQMRDRTGGVVQLEGTRPPKWALHGDASAKASRTKKRVEKGDEKRGPYAEALSITHGRGFNWSAGW